MQLSPASQSLLKSQHIILSGNTPVPQQLQQQHVTQQQQQHILHQHQQQHQTQTLQQQRIVIPKLNIKMEPQMSSNNN